jgi:LemA protein
MAAIFAGLGAVALLAAWLAAAYRGLIAARDQTETTWGAIERQLAARHALVPALIDTIAEHAPGESAVLRRLEAARSAAIAARDPFERADAERRLVAGLLAVGGVLERHPGLGASAAFADVQERLAAAEEGLQTSRRLYNADVRLYLARRRRFPRALLDAVGDFPERTYYELDHTRERSVALSPAV